MLGDLLFRGSNDTTESRTVHLASDDLEAANAVRDQILTQQDVQIPYEISLEYDWDAGNFNYTLRTGQMANMKSHGLVKPRNNGTWDAVEHGKSLD